MSANNAPEMIDLERKRSIISDAPVHRVIDPSKALENAGIREISETDDERPADDQSSIIIPDSVSVADAADLLGVSVPTVRRRCVNGDFPGAKKEDGNGGPGWKIPIAALPESAQRKIKAKVDAALAARAAAIAPPPTAPAVRQFDPAEYSMMWEAYDRSDAVPKRRAEAALAALVAFHELVDSGRDIGDAEKAVASSHGVSKPTLWRYRKATDGHPRMHWLPLLLPRYKGGRPAAEFTPEAYEFILALHKNTSETPLTVVLERARALAPEKGWVIPGYDAVAARLAKEPKWLDTLGRKGPKALERSYPAVERDYSSLALHDLWESDGRKADVFCVWPDGTVARPFIIVWREVRSRLVLSAKGYLQPSAEGVLAAFGQALERAGTAPDYAKLDNGPEYAAKSVSGGQPNRYRFKVVPGEQPGLMTRVGTKAVWSKPGRGQDKPIESFWNFVADRCDKSPEFEGAYCGPNTVSKPEGFDKKKAIPLAAYAAKLAAVLEYFNNEHRHRGSGMNGRTPMEVYTELSEGLRRDPVDPAHLRLARMGVASIKPDRVNASYSLTIPGYGVNRYWSEEIASLPQEVLARKHSVYYDLEAPESPVSIYDGVKWLGDACPIESLPFLAAGDRAGEHVKAKNASMKPKVDALKQIKARAQLDSLPTLPGINSLSALPGVTIEGKRKSTIDDAPHYEDPLEPTENPGEYRDKETGKIYGKKTPAALPESAHDATEDDEKWLAELEKKVREKKLKEGRIF